MDRCFNMSTIDICSTSRDKTSTRRICDVFSDLPGHTDIAECTIELVDDTPIRCKNYPVSFAMEQVVKEEVIKMDRMGITEPSTSDNASPSVIVTKQDGSHRENQHGQFNRCRTYA